MRVGLDEDSLRIFVINIANNVDKPYLSFDDMINLAIKAEM